MYYKQPIVVDRPIGNNAFVYDARQKFFGTAQISIPRLIEGTVATVQLGESIVFAEHIDGEIREFTGLRELVYLRAQSLKFGVQSIPVYVMDNHNHALYCWYREVLAGRVQRGLPLIHIDQHSDMKDPIGWIDTEKENSLDYIAEYVNEVCTIADFIQPDLHTALVSECVQLRTEYGLLAGSPSWRIHGKSQTENRGYILDIDIDFWASEMGIVEFDRTIDNARQLIAGASLVTIATSPCFIDQERALEIVKLLLS